ncbi:DMT family transporter [Patiriisocius hiemis]|uniref:EamA family transporter n=1 Tax=Patiriisocius hiemis TaxID=3075604 RepID=A0ABU2YFB0_9FLAO|nr:EamA family transporter [Constantimarinum sp. W242]MDT0556442.1 EamA family transporter [Constantimarinum sp. W242]
MKGIDKKWVFLFILSVVWGSSFILIKKALIGLTPLQLGALRTIFAAIFLLIIGFNKLKLIKKTEWKWITISAFVGTFIPAFLFAFAETEIDSAIVSVLNSTTPIMTLLLGVAAFSIGFSKNQLAGVIVGLLGSLLLIWSGAAVNPNQNYWYACLILIASVCYATNVNIIKRYLQHTPAMAITAGHFVVILIPAILVLFFSGFFNQATLTSEELMPSLGYLLLLAVIGTGLAKILFNTLVQISTPVFATSVTYTIPIVALFWGLLDGEKFSLQQGAAACLIIFGVYLANRKKKKTT